MFAEEIVINFLRTKMEVPVFMEHPERNPQKSYVILQRVGSSRNESIETVSFTLQSYAPSAYQAAKINDDVKKAMDSLIETEYVSKATLDSDYNYTDTTTKKYRYQAVYDVVFF